MCLTCQPGTERETKEGEALPTEAMGGKQAGKTGHPLLSKCSQAHSPVCALEG